MMVAISIATGAQLPGTCKGGRNQMELRSVETGGRRTSTKNDIVIHPKPLFLNY